MHRTLTEKLLDRPRMLQRLRDAIGDPDLAHMSCFNATQKERTLAVRLGIPIYANDPALEHLGSKSGVKRGWNQVSWAFPLKSGGTESFEDSGKIFVVRRPQTCPEIGRGRSSSSRRQSTSEATKRDSSVIVVQERHMSDADNVVTTTAL